MAYKAPVRDLSFVLHDVLEVERYANHFADADLSRDLIDQIIEEGGKFAEEVIAPINRPGDLFKVGVVICMGGMALVSSSVRHALGVGEGQWHVDGASALVAGVTLGGIVVLSVPTAWDALSAQSTTIAAYEVPRG